MTESRPGGVSLPDRWSRHRDSPLSSNPCDRLIVLTRLPSDQERLDRLVEDQCVKFLELQL